MNLKHLVRNKFVPIPIIVPVVEEQPFAITVEYSAGTKIYDFSANKYTKLAYSLLTELNVHYEWSDGISTMLDIYCGGDGYLILAHLCFLEDLDELPDLLRLKHLNRSENDYAKSESVYAEKMSNIFTNYISYELVDDRIQGIQTDYRHTYLNVANTPEFKSLPFV